MLDHPRCVADAKRYSSPFQNRSLSHNDSRLIQPLLPIVAMSRLVKSTTSSLPFLDVRFVDLAPLPLLPSFLLLLPSLAALVLKAEVIVGLVGVVGVLLPLVEPVAGSKVGWSRNRV